MTSKTWRITPIDPTDHSQSHLIRLAELDESLNGCDVLVRRLRGGLSDGVDLVTLSNGKIEVDVVPTRGMGIREARRGEIRFGWESPVRGPVHPSHVPIHDPSGIGWLEGFDELLVRCGLESNGAPEFDDHGKLLRPLHGRIANKPAHEVALHADSDSGEISLTGKVDETRFLCLGLRMSTTIQLKVGEPMVAIHDTVENLSAKPTSFEMLYHINFGRPVLEHGSRFAAPVKKVMPRDKRAAEGIHHWYTCSDPEDGFQEQVYFMELFADSSGATRSLLTNARSDMGVSVECNKSQLPWFTLWKNTAAIADGYVTGLEPATNFPNVRSFEAENDRVVLLGAREKYTIDLGMHFHCSSQEVAGAESAIAELQSQGAPLVMESPEAPWCVV